MQSAWEGGFGLEDEVAVITEAVGLAFDDLDAIVDAFEDAGVDGVAGVVEDAVLVGEQVVSEAL